MAAILDLSQAYSRLRTNDFDLSIDLLSNPNEIIFFRDSSTTRRMAGASIGPKALDGR